MPYPATDNRASSQKVACDRVAETRSAQGLAPRIDAPAAIRLVVVLLKSVEAQR